MAGSGRAVLVDARSRMMSATGVEGLSFGSELFLFFLGFIPEAFPLVANPCAGRRESNLKRGSYSSIFIDREAISATSSPLHPSYCNSIRFRWIPYNVIAVSDR